MAPKVSKEHFEDRRRHILACAKRVFEQKGYEPVSMQDIVNEAKISRGNLYQYFSSTEEIFREILNSNATDSHKYISSLARKHDSIWEALLEYMNRFLAGDNERFGIVTYEFSVTSWRNEERRLFINSRYDRALNDFVKLLQEGVDRGEFKPLQRLETIVNIMINIWDGLVLEVSIAEKEKVDVLGQMEGLKIYLRTVLSIET
jgi:AcrR family transcriptional regulator